MSSSASATEFLKRPILCGVLAGAMDYYILGNKDTYKNAQFGTSVTIAVAVADGTSGSLLNALKVAPSNAGIALRISEIVFSAGTAYAVNKYVFSNNNYSYSYYTTTNNDLLKRLGVIILADVSANAILDLVNSKPVSLFS